MIHLKFWNDLPHRMSQWANYLISAVRYNDDHSHIVAVRQHLDRGNQVGNGMEVPRSTVVANIKSNQTYATIYLNGSQWSFGERVVIERLHGIEYIKTEADGITADNLGELPEF